jgi:UDP-N-acetylmuramoyl-tripeptide--D-alanyl-D-alanine ligase
MSEARYPLAEAAADLAAAGLFARALVASQGTWRQTPPAQLLGGFAGAVLDSRLAADGRLFLALKGERADGRDFVPAALAAGACALTDTRGPAAADALLRSTAPTAGVVLLSDRPHAAFALLAARWRSRWPGPTIGITGTNGKTTTKDFTAACLAALGPVLATTRNLNNELGVPQTLLDLQPHHRAAVVEMGASAVGDIAGLAALVQPRVGVITNAAPAHLERFGSLEGIVEGKGELLEALPKDGVAILNHDSVGFDAWFARARCRVVSFGTMGGDHRWAWRSGDSEPAGWLDLDGAAWPVPLPGRHNAANLVAAVLAARALGLPDDEIRRGLASFRPSPHRGAVLRLGGRIVLDDCYNANPVSLAAAAEALLALAGGTTWAVVGGMGELGPDSEALHEAVGRRLAELRVARLIAVGENARPLARGFDAAGGIAEYCATHAEAAHLLAERSAVGDRILVKGSRSTAMERVLEELGKLWSPPGE